MYLIQFVARSGICSRRDAAELIKSGGIIVNGVAVTNPEGKVESTDVIKTLEGKILRLQEHYYVIFHKPKGVVTTCSDERGRLAVTELVKIKKGVRLYPVGRLDKDTTGLLLLTNDGSWAQRIMHPRYAVPKIYHAKLDKPLTLESFERLKKGVYLKDGKFKVDRVFFPNPKNRWVVGLEIHSGKYRIIRRAFFSLGYEVEGLHRVQYGNIRLSRLPRGEWKLLKKQDAAQLAPLEE